MFQTRLENSRQVHEFLRPKFQFEQEEFWTVALGSELQVLEAQMLFRGTVNACMIHPRDIIRFVATHNATTFVVAHNHPVGRSLPSREDLAITRNLWKISHLIEIPLTDHLILGAVDYVSLADRGFFHRIKRRQ